MGRLSRRFSFVSCLVFFLCVAWRPSDASNDLSRHPQQSSTKGGGRGLSFIWKLDQPRSLEQDARESSSKLERGDSNSRDLLTASNTVWKITDTWLKNNNNDIQKMIDQTSPGDTIQFQVTTIVKPLQTMKIAHQLYFTTSPKAQPPYTTLTCPNSGSLFIVTSPSFTITGFNIQDCTTIYPVIYVQSEGCPAEPPSVVEINNVVFTNITMKNDQRIFHATSDSCSEVLFKKVDFIDNSCMAVGCVLFPLVSTVTVSRCTNNYDNNLNWDDTAIYLVPAGAEATFTDIDASMNNIRIIYVSADATGTVTSSEFYGNFGRGIINGQSSIITIEDCTFGKNVMSGRYGVSWISGSGEIIAKDSIFERNNGEQGAAITLNNGSAGIIEGCTFSDNLAGGDGGAIQLDDVSNATVSTSNFYRNSAEYGGAAYVDINSTISFDGCTFEGQTAHAFGAAIAAYRGSIVKVANSDMSSNTGDQGGAIRLQKWVTAFIESCTFTNNKAVGDGGAINMWIENTIFISDSTFTDNKALDGAAVFAGDNSVATIDNTLFVNNSCSDRGAAIFIDAERSSAQVTSTNFTGNKGNTCGSVRVQNEAFANFTECYFYDNSAAKDAGGISAHKSGSVIISKTSFIENAATKGGALSVTSKSSMKISDSIVDKNTAAKFGGAFRVEDSSSFEASNTKFTANNGNQGGCGRVDIESSAKAFNCEFLEHSSTKEGGTMMVSDSSLVIVDSTVRSSNAGKVGGAIHLISSEAVANSTYFEDNESTSDGGVFFVGGESNATITDSFITNNDGRNGGAIYAEDKSFTEVRNTVFTNNTAIKEGGAIYSKLSVLLVGEIEVVGSIGKQPGPTITVKGGQFLIDGDSFGFV